MTRHNLTVRNKKAKRKNDKSCDECDVKSRRIKKLDRHKKVSIKGLRIRIVISVITEPVGYLALRTTKEAFTTE